MIGEVHAVVDAAIVNGSVEVSHDYRLSWIEGEPHKLTDAEIQRIKNVVRDSFYQELINETARYFMVEKFVETEYSKKSKYGMQRHRYFSLDGKSRGLDAGLQKLFEGRKPTIEEIADGLKGKKWV